MGILPVTVSVSYRKREMVVPLSSTLIGPVWIAAFLSLSSAEPDMTMQLKAQMGAILDLTKAGKVDEAVALTQAPLFKQSAQSNWTEAATPIEMVPPADGHGPWTAPGPETGKPTGHSSSAFVLRDSPSPVGKRAPGKPVEKGKATGAGAFTRQSYSNAAGARTYKLFVPAQYSGKLMPLVVMLHGCTQSADDFATGTRMNVLAEASGFLVAYPEQSHGANANRCWNWFNASDQMRDQGEPSIIAGLTRKIMNDYAIDPEKVFVAGLSAGGAAAAVLGQVYPDVFRAVGIHSGLACGSAKDMMSAFGVMRTGAAGRPGKRDVASDVRAIVFHGDRDQTVHPLNGDQATAQFAGATTPKSVIAGEASGARFTRTNYETLGGRVVLEQWLVHGGGHTWFGGSPAGTFTTSEGPDASREMVRFFLS